MDLPVPQKDRIFLLMLCQVFLQEEGAGKGEEEASPCSKAGNSRSFLLSAALPPLCLPKGSFQSLEMKARRKFWDLQKFPWRSQQVALFTVLHPRDSLAGTLAFQRLGGR